MRILQVYRDYFTELPGGIERHVHDLAHGLNELGRVDVLASSRAPRARVLDDRGVTVRLVAEFGRVKGVAFCPSFPRTISKGGYDIVHIHSPNPPAEIALKLARVNGARIATYHADTDRGACVAPIYRALLHSALSSCDRVLVASTEIVASSPVLSRLDREGRDVLRVVPFGVDVDHFSPRRTETSDAFRSEWGSAVLFVGRLRYYKGLPWLIEAMRAVDAKLVVAGDGPERERVVTTARRTLGERFVFLGQVPDDVLPDVYTACDLFCLPSTSKAEAFGIACLEAMASGKPVITTDVATATSIINVDGETGFVVAPRDAASLAWAIEKLLADAELRRRMGEAARRRVVERYDKRAMLARVAEIYTEALSQRARVA